MFVDIEIKIELNWIESILDEKIMNEEKSEKIWEI